MEVQFVTKKLERCYLTHMLAVRAWGQTVARKYVQRIGLLRAVSDLAELEALPGLDCHPLKGPRKGQYAILLHDRWRLIFSLGGKKATVILVKEVNKHYGD